MSLSSHQSARMKNDEWLTPPAWIAELGPFDLDPCAPSPSTRPWATAAAHFSKEDDGLSRQWHGRVWCNPPFGREAVKWMARCKDHGNAVVLVPARTETKAWTEHVWAGAAAVCFVRGRPHFHRIDGSRAPFNSGAPIALIAYGERNAAVLEKASLGPVVRP
jgi:hypothetical protein